jgi:hypothetical protein
VNFLGEENMPWSFLTQWPMDVLEAAEKVASRFDMTTESHDGAFVTRQCSATRNARRTLAVISSVLVPLAVLFRHADSPISCRSCSPTIARI